jgi:3-deoxy-D-manno-octulosonate 8-phosphate phosphatase KdsC-like HAD superfamily phosphatase
VNCIQLLEVVGLAACPADAVKKVKEIPGILILEKNGGEGVVREFADLILEKFL